MTGVGFAGYTYMQDIIKARCDSIASATEGRLIDQRDGKIYWVAKLRDGLCWMTQNLDYDGGGILSNLNFISSDTTNNIGKYYDPGEIVYVGTTPTYVGDMLPSTDTNFTGTVENGIYNAHYLVGNYYNWYAATNGTGNSSVTAAGTNVSGSVCPKGWSLPTSDADLNSDGSFNGLAVAYGIGNNAAGSTALRSAPLYFVYGGRVDNSSLLTAGSYGNYWSSTAASATNAYSLYFNSSSVNPSNSRNRYVGLSVRCVAR